MSKEVDLYDGHYGHLAADAQVAVRRETYGEDLGQTSWITLVEARQFLRALGLGAGQAALEVACGSGGLTCLMALETGAACVGVDVNEHGVEGARTRAREQGLSSRGTCPAVDAGVRTAIPCARV